LRFSLAFGLWTLAYFYLYNLKWILCSALTLVNKLLVG